MLETTVVDSGGGRSGREDEGPAHSPGLCPSRGRRWGDESGADLTLRPQ